MKNVFVLAIWFCFSSWGLSQTRELPVTVLDDIRLSGLFMLNDSVVELYNAPAIEVFTFHVEFYKGMFNSKTHQLRLTGQICLGDTNSKCNGVPNVTVFKAKKDHFNKLNAIRDLGESSYLTDSLEKGGFFDVNIKVQKGESVFFYMPHFYLEEYKTDQLLNYELRRTLRKVRDKASNKKRQA